MNPRRVCAWRDCDEVAVVVLEFVTEPATPPVAYCAEHGSEVRFLFRVRERGDVPVERAGLCRARTRKGSLCGKRAGAGGLCAWHSRLAC